MDINKHLIALLLHTITYPHIIIVKYHVPTNGSIHSFAVSINPTPGGNWLKSHHCCRYIFYNPKNLQEKNYYKYVLWAKTL